MRPGRAADHSPISSAAAMDEQSYTSTHPLGHTGPVMGSLYFFSFSKYYGTFMGVRFSFAATFVDKPVDW